MHWHMGDGQRVEFDLLSKFEVALSPPNGTIPVIAVCHGVVIQLMLLDEVHSENKIFVQSMKHLDLVLHCSALHVKVHDESADGSHHIV